MPSGPLHVLVVMTNATQRGGAEKLLQHLYRRCGQRLRLSIAFLEDGPMVLEAKASGAEVRIFPSGRFLNLVRTARCVLALRSWIADRKPDLVLGWMKKSHLYASPASRGIAPCVWFQHENPGSGPIDRLIHALPAKAVLCCSDYVRAQQATIVAGTPSYTIHPAQDVLAEPPAEVDWPVPPGCKGLLMVCRLQSWKGVHLVVETLGRMARAGDTTTHLVVVGGAHDLEPDYTEKLVRQISRLRIRSRVHLVGYQRSPASWMRKADVLVHASQREPFGMVVAEAIALGVPVVAAIPGGPAEIVQEAEGRLWNHPDLDELERAIAAALENGVSAPRPRRFSVESYSARIDAVLREIVGLQG